MLRPHGSRRALRALLTMRPREALTPAMAAGVTDKLWEISDVVAMLETWEKQSIAVS
jgi:hypothetical protein